MGLDPGLASTGWGVLEVAGSRLVCRDYGCIETQAATPIQERLLTIYQGVVAAIEKYKPQEGAIETLYFGRNVSSAISVAEARGVLELIMAQQGLLVHEFKPNDIKKSVVGIITADKAQVQHMVKLLLGLDEIPRPDHAADALAAAITAAHSSI
jgi:crossover junction endodeoxyribonuclease RuvC